MLCERGYTTSEGAQPTVTLYKYNTIQVISCPSNRNFFFFFFFFPTRDGMGWDEMEDLVQTIKITLHMENSQSHCVFPPCLLNVRIV